jgi:hypothetical protein
MKQTGGNQNMTKAFQPLPLSTWRKTRDTLAGYTRFVRRIRQFNSAKEKHYWHVSLRPTATGLTTTPIRSQEDIIYELEFDLTKHLLEANTSQGERREVPLLGQSPKQFKEETLAALAELGIQPTYDEQEFNDEAPGAYDETAVSTYWDSLIEIHSILKEFRAGFLEETSPVQLWPHHFDLAMVWFSGRNVPGQDPDNPEYADEQMNFGFSTGDDDLPEPYFYATAYPTPEGWVGSSLPEGAYWNNNGWSGAVLPYQKVVEAEDGRRLLLDFLYAAQGSGSKLMKDSQ